MQVARCSWGVLEGFGLYRGKERGGGGERLTNRAFRRHWITSSGRAEETCMCVSPADASYVSGLEAILPSLNSSFLSEYFSRSARDWEFVIRFKVGRCLGVREWRREVCQEIVMRGEYPIPSSPTSLA